MDMNDLAVFIFTVIYVIWYVYLIVYSIVLQRSSLSVVEVWREGCYLCEVRRVAKAGLRVILASPWYLDQPGPTHNWARYYTVWPLAFKGQNRTCVLWLVLTGVLFVFYNNLQVKIDFLWNMGYALTKTFWLILQDRCSACIHTTRWQWRLLFLHHTSLQKHILCPCSIKYINWIQNVK